MEKDEYALGTLHDFVAKVLLDIRKGLYLVNYAADRSVCFIPKESSVHFVVSVRYYRKQPDENDASSFGEVQVFDYPGNRHLGPRDNVISFDVRLIND